MVYQSDDGTHAVTYRVSTVGLAQEMSYAVEFYIIVAPLVNEKAQDENSDATTDGTGIQFSAGAIFGGSISPQKCFTDQKLEVALPEIICLQAPDCMYELSTKRPLPSFVTLKDSKVFVKATKADLNSKDELEVRIEFILETIDPD